MSGVIHRVLIFAALDGLILQAHGSVEHHKVLHIDYATNNVVSRDPSTLPPLHDNARLDSHGVIGLLSVFSFSYLIAVTSRRQVARIFGKPVYVITDIAIIPLTSHQEAAKAIEGALSTQQAESGDDTESDSDALAPELKSYGNYQVATDPPEAQTLEPESEKQLRASRPRSTIAEDVFTKRGQFGRFASHWFSGNGWGLQKRAQEGLSAEPPGAERDAPATDMLSEVSQIASKECQPDLVAGRSSSRTVEEKSMSKPNLSENLHAFLPKILRTTKRILSSKCFFFSYDYNLTRSIGSGATDSIQESGLDPEFFWNMKLGTSFLKNGHQHFLLPVMQGFVGQRSFNVEWDKKGRSHSVIEQPLELENEPASTDASPSNASQDFPIESTQCFLLTVLSRRSTKRAGLRYLRRGVDDGGNCANFVETEQILTSDPWDKVGKYTSFIQIRGSIPLYFSQEPFSLKPVPVLHQSEALNQKAFTAHFRNLQSRYGGIQISCLVDKHGGEVAIGEAYEAMTKTANVSGDIKPLRFDWFDFHQECRGMKFENVQRLVNKLEDVFRDNGENVVKWSKVVKKQTGVIRTNCMDCLDRTNVVQSAFAQYILQHDLQDMGFDIDLVHDERTQWFNSLWADNGDAISRAYAGSSALKGDFTRTRKRNYRGALNDFGLTLTRYYNNIVNDYFAQAVIDVLLGNVSATVFEDFESNMKSADPGISIAKVREAAVETCTNLVIQGATEDLIHGWTMLSPAQPNTLRTLPFEEVVVLLTDAALYCCKFNWNTEKVISFEKVDLSSITNIKYGTYITSTLTSRQRDEDLNVGLVVSYSPGQGNLIRVNTRSLQNTLSDGSQGIDGGTGIFSWLPTQSSSTTRFMALKIVPKTSEEELESGRGTKDMAEHVSMEIRRTILTYGRQTPAQKDNIVEQGTIITLAEAKQRTSYLEHVTHSIKKLVWT